MPNNILLIEDNYDTACSIRNILQLAHYNVTHAVNGKCGIEIAQRNQPDLILCNIIMPEIDGFGVLHILNKDPSTASIPFIFLTTNYDQSDFRTGMNLGADDYLTKPFNHTDLLSVIELRLKKNQLLRSSFKNDNNDFSLMFNKTIEVEAFQKLSKNRTLRSLKKKECLFMEGQTPINLYYIDKGLVKTYKINSEGKELITGIHGEGDFLGYGALLEENLFNESAEVMEEVRILIIPKEEFLNLIYSNKDIAKKFIMILSNKLEETKKRLLDQAYQSVRQRVAKVLLSLNDRFTYANNEVIIKITRKDISNIVGTATESLNRTLADFKDEGFIEISDEGLKITNKHKLERLLY